MRTDETLRGQTAIITGASAGIGRRVAQAFAARGLNVVLAARSVDALESLAAELRAQGVRALVVPVDVSVQHDLERLVNATIDEFGRVDVLVNNAGIDAYHDFHTLSVERIRRTIEVNLTGSVVLTRLVIPHMLDNGIGRVINMASTAGRHGPAFGAVYGLTKSALISFTQSLRLEYHGTGIGVTALCPGFTDDGGIYERMKQKTGRGTPTLIGSTSADAVADAAVNALRTTPPDVILNSSPMRPVTALRELFPSLGEWIIRKTSRRFLHRISRATDEQETRPAEAA